MNVVLHSLVIAIVFGVKGLFLLILVLTDMKTFRLY